MLKARRTSSRPIRSSFSEAHRFSSNTFDDYSDWSRLDRKIFERVRRIIIETARSPFEGIGKPEPLKHELKGYWSRRITEEHRLVYKVTDEQIIIISCKYHYE